MSVQSPVFRSTNTHDGYSRGRRLLVVEPKFPITDDTAGEAVDPYTYASLDDEEDATKGFYDAPRDPVVVFLHDPVKTAVVRMFGQEALAKNPRDLATVLVACNAANQLANLAGDCEVCRTLDWTGEPPQTLRDFGMERLLRGAAVLRDRVKAIRARAAATPAPRTSGGIRPRVTTQPSQTSTPKPPTPRVQPISPELQARIEVAKKAAIRLNSPGASQKLVEALATTHSRERAERLVAEAEQMIRNCEALALARTQQSRPTTPPRPRDPREALLADNPMLESILRRGRR